MGIPEHSAGNGEDDVEARGTILPASPKESTRRNRCGCVRKMFKAMALFPCTDAVLEG